MDYFSLFNFFFYGLIVGSFLNVVLVRTERETRLTGRSHCPQCDALIRWYDNIPLLSFFLLQGRCRSCQAKISWQYPLVELATGGLFILPALFVFDSQSSEKVITALWWCFLFSVLLIISVYDLRHMEIPLSFLLWGIGGALLYFLVLTYVFRPTFDGQSPIIQALIGGGSVAMFFYALVFFSRERWMGMGDVWLGFLSGMAVGPGFAFLLITLSFILGVLVAIPLILLGKKERTSKIPFAPYLALATILLLMLAVHPPLWMELFLFPRF